MTQQLVPLVSLMKYGASLLPFNSLEKMQESFSVPLPASTQWKIVDAAATTIAPPSIP